MSQLGVCVEGGAVISILPLSCNVCVHTRVCVVCVCTCMFMRACVHVREMCVYAVCMCACVRAVCACVLCVCVCELRDAWHMRT